MGDFKVRPLSESVHRHKIKVRTINFSPEDEDGNEFSKLDEYFEKLPADHIVAAAVSVLWSSGEIVERVPPRILEVISESR